MRFYSFCTDYKYSMDRITRQEIYTDGPDGGLVFAFTLEAEPAARAVNHPLGYQIDEAGNPLVVMPDPTLDFEVVLQACQVWMEQQGLVREPAWFLSLPPGKTPEEFLTILGHRPSAIPSCPPDGAA